MVSKLYQNISWIYDGDSWYKDMVNGKQSSFVLARNNMNQSPINHASGFINRGSVVDSLAYNLSSSPPINVSLPMKLDDSNYMIWRDQLLTYLTAYGLEGMIDSSLI